MVLYGSDAEPADGYLVKAGCTEILYNNILNGQGVKILPGEGESFSEKMQIVIKRGSLQDTRLATIVRSKAIYCAKRIAFQQKKAV